MSGVRRPAVVAVSTLALLGVSAAASAAWPSQGAGVATARAGSLSAPGAPSATAATSSSIALTWSASSAPAGASVRYRVERATAAAPSTFSPACGGTDITTTSCSDTGLAASTEYVYRLTGLLGSAWASAPSSARLSTPAAAGVTVSTPDLVSDYDSNVTTDDITNSTTLVLAGTSSPSASIAVTDGQNSAGTATADASGAWFLTLTSVTEGVHTYSAVATRSGTSSPRSSTLTVVVDRTAPAVTVSTAVGKGGSGNLNASGTLGTATNDLPAVDITVTDASGAVVDGGPALLSGATWTYQSKKTLVDKAAYTLTAVQRDVAGNKGSNAKSFTG